MSPDPPGPFDSEREARELPAVRAVYEAFRADPGLGKIGPNHRMLLDALAAAGVYLGAYDHRIAEWLAGWEPQTVAVIAAWVERAARTREGPPGRETGDGPLPEGTASTPPGHHHASEAAGMRITRGGDGGRAPREAAP